MQEIQQSTTTDPLTFFMASSSDGKTAVTGITPVVTLSKNGGAFASPSGIVSEIGNGWYQVAGNATDNNTLGVLILHATGAGADAADTKFIVVVHSLRDAVRGTAGTALPGSGTLAVNPTLAASQTFNNTGTWTGNISGNVTGSVNSVTTGVTVTTNNDKGGYSLTQGFPTNFSAMAIAAGTGAVTVGTNNDKTGYTVSTVGDKTGYSLASSQTFNMTGNITGNLSGSVGSVSGAVGSVTAGVTVTTNNDKTGYTASTVSDKTGYSLASTGLDSIAVSEPSTLATTFPKMLVQLWMRFFRKTTATSTQLKMYAADTTTVVTTQALSDDGTTQTVGNAS